MPSAPVQRIPRTDEEIERAAAEDDDARLATAEELADARRAYQTPGKAEEIASYQKEFAESKS